jgi:hypothetical protein
MKKILLIIVLCSLPLMLSSETSCPSGQTDCNSPCASYVDYDEDEKCDYVQSNLQEKNIIKKAENKKQIIKIKEQKKQIIKPKTLKPIKTIPIKKTYKRKSYRLFPISISLLLLYILTLILSGRKMIEPRTHFKFWNLALLLTFLISASLGILLVIMINFGLRLNLPFNILLWHTEAGICMFMISLFHIHWHWRYIKNMFRIKGYDTSRIKKLYPTDSRK